MKKQRSEDIPLGHITDQEWDDGWEAIEEYAKGRLKFCEAQKRQQKLLHGNDNKVGIIGEYWAMRYYQECLKRVLEDRPGSSSNPGYDFRYREGSKEFRVTVKSVSMENEKGRTVRLADPEHWDELLLVTLDYDLRPLKFGRATKPQYNRVVADGRIGKNPYASRSWVNPKGWMSREEYGTVEDSPF